MAIPRRDVYLDVIEVENLDQFNNVRIYSKNLLQEVLDDTADPEQRRYLESVIAYLNEQADTLREAIPTENCGSRIVLDEEIRICKLCETEIKDTESYCNFCKDKINYETFGE
jgi:hypothetical protein